MIGVPVRPAKPTTNVDMPTYVPTCDPLGRVDLRGLIKKPRGGGVRTYLTGMVCSVCHSGHHQRDNDAARRSKQNRQHDQSVRRVDLEPAEQQNGRAVTREGDDVELAEILGNRATEHPPHEEAPVDQGEQVRSEARCHSICQTYSAR